MNEGEIGIKRGHKKKEEKGRGKEGREEGTENRRIKRDWGKGGGKDVGNIEKRKYVKKRKENVGKIERERKKRGGGGKRREAMEMQQSRKKRKAELETGRWEEEERRKGEKEGRKAWRGKDRKDIGGGR